MNLLLDKLQIQYLPDANGKQTAVRIAIEDWKKLEKEYRKMAEYVSLREELKTAFEEVKDMQNGVIPKRSLKEFLDDN